MRRRYNLCQRVWRSYILFAQILFASRVCRLLGLETCPLLVVKRMKVIESAKGLMSRFRAKSSGTRDQDTIDLDEHVSLRN